MNEQTNTRRRGKHRCFSSVSRSALVPFLLFFFPLLTLLKLLCTAFHHAALPPSIVSLSRSHINFDNTRGYRTNYIAKMSLTVEVLKEREKEIEREKGEKMGRKGENDNEKVKRIRFHYSRRVSRGRRDVCTALRLKVTGNVLYLKMTYKSVVQLKYL